VPKPLHSFVTGNLKRFPAHDIVGFCINDTERINCLDNQMVCHGVVFFYPPSIGASYFGGYNTVPVISSVSRHKRRVVIGTQLKIFDNS